MAARPDLDKPRRNRSKDAGFFGPPRAMLDAKSLVLRPPSPTFDPQPLGFETKSVKVGVQSPVVECQSLAIEPQSLTIEARSSTFEARIPVFDRLSSKLGSREIVNRPQRCFPSTNTSPRRMAWPPCWSSVRPSLCSHSLSAAAAACAPPSTMAVKWPSCCRALSLIHI